MSSGLAIDSDVRAARDCLREHGVAHVFENDRVRRLLTTWEHTERCTGHVHGPCDCGLDYLVGIAGKPAGGES
jgi:hypothetical protein